MKEGLAFWAPLSESESEVTQSCPWTVAYQAPQSMEFSRQEYIEDSTQITGQTMH